MRRYFIAVPFMLATVVLAACGSGSDSYTSYQCPMKCENNKVYDKPGACPVCGMDLEGIESK